MDKYARQPIHRITLRQLLAIGSKPTPQKLIVAAQYLRDEVLVRLSRRVRDLGNLPFGLSNLAPIRQIRTLYIRAFIESTKVPAKVTEDNDLVMTAQLGHTLRRNLHNGVWLSHVLMQLKRDGKIVADDESETLLLQEFIDRFLNSRLGLRLLSAQHVAIHNPKPGFIGIVETNCVVADVCGQAIASASHVCNETYGHVPPVVLEGDVKATFRYVPEVLHQIVFELLKNSMRATLEHHDGTPVASMPPIRLVIARSKSGDVSINVADQGGGIPREDLPHVWSHLFSTAPMPNVPPKDMASDDADEAHGAELGGDVEDPDAIFDPVLSVPMAGYGYGLPIARIYARYFGGDLRIVPMVGYGTDAYVYLPAFERMMDKELEG